MRRVVAITLGVVFVGMFLLVGTSQGADQQTLIQKVRNNYQEITSFQADISVQRSEQRGEGQGKGNIWAKEGKFRMEMETIVSESAVDEIIKKQVIVFDGKSFWMHSQPENEVITIDLTKLSGLPDLARAQIEDTVTQLEEGA